MRKITQSGFKRIYKSVAKRLYNSGRTLKRCPVNMRVDSCSLDFNKSCGEDFDQAVKEFIHYNCNNSEVGHYPAFYIEEK